MSKNRIESSTSMAVMERAWNEQFGTPRNLFQVWDLRAKLASLSNIAPLLMVDKVNDCAVALGKTSSSICFFGGEFYNERNRLLGQAQHSYDLLKHLAVSYDKIKLLSLEQDLAPQLDADSQLLDVPFNQYWEFLPEGDFSSYLAGRSAKRRKRIAGFFRKEEIRVDYMQKNPLHIPEVQTLMERHDAFLQKRGKNSANSNETFKKSLETVFEHVISDGQLLGVWALSGSQVVGFGSLAISEKWTHAVYLTNFYDPNFANSSHMVVAGIVKAAFDLNLKIDGMRGSFGLKKAFQFQPTPSYALVKDESWRIRPQTDLEQDEIAKLYGRVPGYGSDNG